MEVNRRSFICGAAVGGVLVASGEALATEPVGGKVTAGGRPLAGVVVSDGINCVETKADGTWVLPANARARFISVTVPSGWKIARHYLKYAGPGRNYDFALEPWAASRTGKVAFVHIGDSEIQLKRLDDERRWVAKTKALAAETGAAFVVHTGDIDGQRMPKHAELMNAETVGCPVFYVVGNHDLKGPVRAEQIFEDTFGPCWYSFDAGGTHFVATPMIWGDGKPDYGVEDVVAWLRNDLAIAARRQQPVVILTHGGVDSRLWDLRKLFSHSVITTESREPFEVTALCQVRAVVHGHIHQNYCYRSDDGRLAIVSAAPPNKNDATLQVVRLDARGRVEKVDNVFDLEHQWQPPAPAMAGGWLAKTGGGNVYYSMPAIGAGNVYVGTVDYSGACTPGLWAFDARTGERRWFFKTRGDVMSSALVRGDRVFVNDTFWQVYALEAQTGRVIWHFDARDEVGYTGSRMWGGASGFSQSFLNYDAATNRLFVGSAFKSLFALDPETAKVVWRTDATHGIFLGSPTPCAVCDEVIVGRANWAGTFGYDARTGKTLWTHRLGDAPTAQERHRLAEPWLECMGFPVYRGGKLILTGHNRYFEADPKTGKILRERAFPFSVSCFTSPVFHAGRIYFGSASEGLVCLDESTLEIVWKASVEPALYSLPAYKYSPIRSLCSVPVVWRDLVWATAQDGAVYAWDPQTGERRKWIFTGVPYLASAAVDGDRLYVADFAGNVRCLA